MTLLTFEVQVIKKIIPVIRPVCTLLHSFKIVICLFYSFIHNGLVRESVQGLSFLVTNEFAFIYSVLYCVSSQLHAQEHTYKQYICY